MKHEYDDGVNKDSNLSRLEPDSVRASVKEDSLRTTTLTDNKKRDYENEGHQLRSRSVLHVVNSIVVAVTIYSIFDLYANSL